MQNLVNSLHSVIEIGTSHRRKQQPDGDRAAGNEICGRMFAPQGIGAGHDMGESREKRGKVGKSASLGEGRP